jgi:hypothetical protein
MPKKQSSPHKKLVNERNVNVKFKGLERCKKRHRTDRPSLMLSKPKRSKNSMS